MRTQDKVLCAAQGAYGQAVDDIVFLFFYFFQRYEHRNHEKKGVSSMLCRDEALVIDKLCSLGEKFNELFEKKEYERAMYAYYTASSVAVFLEMDRDMINFFFGTANTEETDEKGLFDRDRVHRAHGECIHRNKDRPYVSAADMVEILRCTTGR